MTRPLPALARATLILCIGLLLGFRAAGLPHTAAVLGFFACSAALVLDRRLATVGALGALLTAGVYVGQRTARETSGDCRERIPDGARVVVRGVFEGQAVPGGAVPLSLRELRVAGRTIRCSGALRARIGTAVRELPPAGAEVTARGRFWAHLHESAWPRPPERAGLLVLDSVSVPRGIRDRQLLLAARATAQERLHRLLPKRAAVAEALLLARTEGLDPELRDRFARAGLAHLLSISGQHVALIAAGLLLLCRMARLRRSRGDALVAVVVVAYVLFLGAPYAATRAALLVLLALAARMLQRPADPIALLAAAALALLAYEPIAVLDAGFQLSFAGTAGILLLGRRFLEALHPYAGKFLADCIGTSLAATLATAPISALHFGTVAPVGILSNIAATPLMALAVPALAVTLAAGALHEGMGVFFGGGAELLLAALEWVAAVAAAVPGGHALVPRDAVASWVLAALAAGAASGWLTRMAPASTGRAAWAGGGRRGVRPAIRRIAAAGVALALLVAWPVAVRLAAPGVLEIHAIDVGQGDAIAIRSPAGRWLLVDAGPRTDRFDAGRRRVVPYLLRHGARRLEAMILTHPDADHIGGAQAVLEALPVGAIVDPGIVAGKSLYLDLLRAARAGEVRWFAARAGRELHLDDMTLEFLYPEAGMLDGIDRANDYSVVFRLRYGPFAALFLGDAPAAVENALAMSRGRSLRADVVKVGHHGSRTSTSEALLDAAAPQWALISVGRRNRFGHPAPDVLDRLERRGVRVLRTDLDGSVTIRVHRGGSVEVVTAR